MYITHLKIFPVFFIETHISLIDGANCGIRSINYKAISVQYHPEPSPGPQDSYYLFERFTKLISLNKEALKFS